MTAIITRCFFMKPNQWTQLTIGLVDEKTYEVSNISTFYIQFKGYAYKSLKFILSNYNYYHTSDLEQLERDQLVGKIKDFLTSHNVNKIYMHPTLLAEFKRDILNNAGVVPIVSNNGIHTCVDCYLTINHNTNMCSRCIFYQILSEVNVLNK